MKTHFGIVMICKIVMHHSVEIKHIYNDMGFDENKFCHFLEKLTHFPHKCAKIKIEANVRTSSVSKLSPNYPEN